MGILYLLALVVALFGMVMLDRRFRLFFWRDARRATVVLVVGLVFFLGWDVSGIGLGIFFRGETSFMTGLLIGPELPLEEVFFLALLCYLTMNLFGFLSRAGRGAEVSYWQLNLVFLVVVVIVVGFAASRHRARLPWVAVAATLVILLLVTAIFDNVMIGIGLVGYDRAKISGAFVGMAPLEDFAYAFAAAVLLPSVWMLLPARSPSKRSPGEPPAGRDA